MEILNESLHGLWEGTLRLTPKLVLAIVIVVLAVVIGRVVAAGLWRVLERGRLSIAHRGFFRNVTRWLVIALGVAIALNVLGLNGALRGFMAGGGLTAIILGFAFRDIGENFLAGFLLAFDRHFNVGDLIQSGEFTGTVQEIALRSTHIRTADGRDIFIPSARIFSNPLVNFTRDGLRRPSFTVGIDYGDDAEKARGVILEAVRTVPGVLDTPAPEVLVGRLADQYVEIETFFWIDTFDQEKGILQVVSAAQERTRRALVDGGFTVSSNVSTAVDLRADPVRVQVE
jgi:small-conductance mechanosensitive channel